jgi:hypothetical protein
MKSTMLFRFLLISRVLLAGLALSGAAAPELYAASFLVTTKDDTKPGNGLCPGPNCSLRAAVEQASDLAEDSDIFAPRGFYKLTEGALKITGAPKNIQLAGELSSDGSPNLTIIDGNRLSTVFEISQEGGKVNIFAVTIQHGKPSLIGSGGGIEISNGNSLDLTLCVVRDNTSSQGGAGINNHGSLTLILSIVENSVVTGEGGGLTGFGGGIRSYGEALLQGSIIRKNTAIRGGGISNQNGAKLQIAGGCVFRGNEASLGGAIYNAGGNVSLSKSTISANKASKLTGDNPFSRYGGGGIANTGLMGIHDCTISGNTANPALDPVTLRKTFIGGRGGGISNLGGVLIIDNSTISGNEATGGGAILNDAQGEVDLFFTTITKNKAVGRFHDANSDQAPDTWVGGGIANYVQPREGAPPPMTMSFTILAGNINIPNISFPGLISPDCYNKVESGFISDGHNVVGVVNENCVLTKKPSDQFGTIEEPLDPKLEPLDNNGGLEPLLHIIEAGFLSDDLGPTLTHALLPESPAIDIGECPFSGQQQIHTDQRGALRPAGQGCDAGAFEFGNPEDITKKLHILLSGFIYDRRQNQFRQQVTLRNNTPDSISGQFFLVLDHLSVNARLVNEIGLSENVFSDEAPKGAPYISVDVGDNVLEPKETATVTLYFNDPSQQPILYTPRVLAGEGIP